MVQMMHPAILIYRLVQNVFVIIVIIPTIIHNFISFFSVEKNKTMRSATIKLPSIRCPYFSWFSLELKWLYKPLLLLCLFLIPFYLCFDSLTASCL